MSPRKVRKSSSPCRSDALRSSLLILRTGISAARRGAARGIVFVAMTPPDWCRPAQQAPGASDALNTVAASQSEVHAGKGNALVGDVLRAGKTGTSGEERRRRRERRFAAYQKERHRLHAFDY